MKRRSPFNDYYGDTLFEGDFICHPNGEVGRIVFDSSRADIHSQWRVDYYYHGEPTLALFLQVDERGRAIKLNLAYTSETRH